MASWIVFVAAGACVASATWFQARGERRGLYASLGALVLVLGLGVVLLRGVLEMQKVAAYLYMPLSLMWVSFGVLAVRWLAQGARWRALGAALYFVAYGLGGNAIFASFLYGILEESLPKPVPIAEQPVFDVAFVLGGGIIRRPDDHALHLTEWADRLLAAADLYEAGKVKVIVGSGHEQSEASARFWRRLGVPAEAIREIPVGRITSEEMREYKAMADREGWKKIALISSAYHLPRSIRDAKLVGMEVTPIATNLRWPPPPTYDPMFALPHPDSWAKTQLVLWELAGMIVGR